MGTMDGDLPDTSWGPCINPGEVLKDRNGDFLASLDIYTTSNGNDYEFLFEKQDNGSIRIEIVKQPDYGSRDSSLQTTARQHQQDTRRFCVDTRAYELSTLSYAKEAAAQWARHTDRYITTGKPLYG